MHKSSIYAKITTNKIAILAIILTGIISLPFNNNAANLILKKNDRIAIVGDSITEQKRYSKFMELYLLACVPQLNLTMYQFGWSGEKAPHFAKRMENDLIPWHPTVVTTCYGMNDGFYRPYNDQIGKTYKDSSSQIQNRCKKLGIRMIVGGPGSVDTDSWRRDQPDADQYYNDNLAKLSEIAGQLAISNGFEYAQLHKIMMDVMQKAKAEKGNDYNVCGSDGVHPGDNGHLIMAYAFLKAMGLNGEIGTITIDLNTGDATGTDGQQIISSNNKEIKIKSTRYPFCFTDDPKDASGSQSILPFLPFNQDLNRYMLIVKNLSTPTAEIKWGDSIKTFTREDLENGINLAAEFTNNPFLEPFRTLDKIVTAKQRTETYTIRNIITNFRKLALDFPDDQNVADAIAILSNKLLKQNARDAVRVRAAVKPVVHLIEIKPIPSK